MTLTKLQLRALTIAPTLSRDGRFTCAMLGEALFAPKRFKEWKVWLVDVQRWSRPGGKVIAALMRNNRVERDFGGDRWHVYYKVKV